MSICLSLPASLALVILGLHPATSQVQERLFLSLQKLVADAALMFPLHSECMAHKKRRNLNAITMKFLKSPVVRGEKLWWCYFIASNKRRISTFFFCKWVCSKKQNSFLMLIQAIYIACTSSTWASMWTWIFIHNSFSSS